jgi:hypothetical protein
MSCGVSAVVVPHVVVVFHRRFTPLDTSPARWIGMIELEGR